MREIAKPVTFEFEFQHAYRGNIVSGNTITVREPGFADRGTYRQMKAWVSDAFRNMQKMQTTEMRARADEVATEVGPDVIEAAVDAIDPYMILSMGLEGEKFAEFCTFVEKVLTNNPRLAFCGDDAENGVPVTQVIWQDIAGKGGVEAIEKVCAAFAGFFLAGPSRRTSTPTEPTGGNESASGQPADPLAPSLSHKRKK